MKHTPTILIIEDDPALNEAYRMILEMADYTVKTAYNGEEALKVAKQFPPSVIFLDLRMPVLDGIGFLEKYEAKKLHPEVRVIVFSNYDEQAEVDEAYALGAERYVLKAMASPKALLKIVKDLT